MTTTESLEAYTDRANRLTALRPAVRAALARTWAERACSYAFVAMPASLQDAARQIVAEGAVDLAAWQAAPSSVTAYRQAARYEAMCAVVHAYRGECEESACYACTASYMGAAALGASEGECLQAQSREQQRQLAEIVEVLP